MEEGCLWNVQLVFFKNAILEDYLLRRARTPWPSWSETHSYHIYESSNQTNQRSNQIHEITSPVDVIKYESDIPEPEIKVKECIYEPKIQEEDYVQDPNEEDEEVEFPLCLVEFLPCLPTVESEVDPNSSTMAPNGLA